VPSVFVVNWPTIQGKQYQLQVSHDLATWTPIDDPSVGDGTPIQIAIEAVLEDDTQPPKLFWRVSVSDIDSDGDGLSDYEEGILGTDPHNPDTDGDGQSDGAEVIAHTNPLGPADTTDSDNDGIVDSLDADPGDPAISWLASSPSNYAVFELPPLPSDYSLLKLGDGLHVLAHTYSANYSPGGMVHGIDGDPDDTADPAVFNTFSKVLPPGGATWLDLPQSSGDQGPTHFYGVANGVDGTGTFLATPGSALRRMTLPPVI